MGKVIITTSLKGGVGKTVFSACLADTLSRRGFSVLAVDLDLGAGGLDIALGRENDVTATMLDVLRGEVNPERALTPGEDGITFLAAPVFFNPASLEEVSQADFNRLLSTLKDSFDFVLFDMPAGGGAAFPFVERSRLADQYVLVTTAAPTAVRAAERCAMRLAEPEKAKLLLNCFRLSRPDDNTFGIVEVIRRASVPILGVIPYDNGAEKALAKGVPLSADQKSPAGNAVGNVASRLLDEPVPLFDGIMRRNRRMSFYGSLS
ncbi:MAG: AAA family ATPase [Clostridia bacterium]|nr:AAA family ATPase [Clostridia bacterium]